MESQSSEEYDFYQFIGFSASEDIVLFLTEKHIYKGYGHHEYIAIHKDVVQNFYFSTIALDAVCFKPLNNEICKILFE